MRALFRPKIFRLIFSVSCGYPHCPRVPPGSEAPFLSTFGNTSGIWNRHSASICHCGDPYQTESDPNTMRSSPKYFTAWPSRWAQTLGKVITLEANVVPSSAYTFGYGAEVWKNCVLQWMFGTPLRRFPDFRSSYAPGGYGGPGSVGGGGGGEPIQNPDLMHE